MATCTTCGTTSGTSVTKKATGDTCESEPWISCEECNALKRCVKTVVCDVLRCLADALCTPAEETRDEQGKIVTNKSRFAPVTGQTLGDCLKTAICSFAECIPDAICAPRAVPPAPGPDLPCEFAVEEQLSVQAPQQTQSFTQQQALQGKVLLVKENP